MKIGYLILFLVISVLVIAGCGGGPTCTKDEKGCVDNSVAFCSQGQWIVEKDCDESNQVCENAVCGGKNYPPSVNIGSDLNVGVDEVVYLTADINDQDGDKLTFKWDVVSSPTRDIEYGDIETLEPWFKPSKKGEYIIELVVRDDVTSSSDKLIVNVN